MMLEAVKKVILILAGMGGIILDKINIHRLIHFLILIFIYFLFRRLQSFADLPIAAAVFISFFIIRYIFLFSSFIENGLADRLKRSFGEEKGFYLYKTITAIMFFTGGLSFSLVVMKSGLDISYYSDYAEVFKLTGVLLAAGGMIINIWSTYLVGLDVYYYKDLFLRKKITDFRYEGPYKLFSNPMYGPGQSNGYGTALIYGSIEGVIGMFMNQVMMYIFFFSIEKPHIIRILKSRETEEMEIKKTG